MSVKVSGLGRWWKLTWWLWGTLVEDVSLCRQGWVVGVHQYWIGCIYTSNASWSEATAANLKWLFLRNIFSGILTAQTGAVRQRSRFMHSVRSIPILGKKRGRIKTASCVLMPNKTHKISDFLPNESRSSWVVVWCFWIDPTLGRCHLPEGNILSLYACKNVFEWNCMCIQHQLPPSSCLETWNCKNSNSSGSAKPIAKRRRQAYSYLTSFMDGSSAKRATKQEFTLANEEKTSHRPWCPPITQQAYSAQACLQKNCMHKSLGRSIET